MPLPGPQGQPGRRIASRAGKLWGSVGVHLLFPRGPRVGAVLGSPRRWGRAGTSPWHKGVSEGHRHPRPPGDPARVGLGAVVDPVVLDASGRGTEQLLKHGHQSTRESRGTAPLRCGDRWCRRLGWSQVRFAAPLSRLSRTRTRALAPPPPRATPRGAPALRFRCKTCCRGILRTARTEGGTGHSVPQQPSKPRGVHRKSAGWRSVDPAAERMVWGQMGGNGVCRGSTRSRRSRAVRLSALSPGIPEPGPGLVWVTGSAGMSGPTRPRARGAPRQLLPLTLGAWKAARVPVQLLLPVAWLCGRGPAVPPAPGAEISGHPSAAVGTVRVPSRSPLPRPARLEQLCRTSSGPRPPRVAVAPAPAHPPAGIRALPPRRRSLRAAFPALFSFACRLLPAPPAPQPGRSSGPARVPRGFRRQDGAISPLTSSWEAAGTSASPLYAPTRGRAASPRLRGAPRRRRGKGSCAVGSYAAPQGLRVASVPGGTASDPRFQRTPRTPTAKVPGRYRLARGCGSPTATGMGAAVPAPVLPGGHGQLPTQSLAPRAGTRARCRRLCPLRSTFPGTGSGEPSPRQFTSRPATGLN